MPTENNKKLKVLHVVSDDLWGGAEAQSQILIEGTSHYHDLALLTLNEGQLLKKIMAVGNIKTFTVNENSGLIKLIQNSYKIIKNFRPDIIHSHGYKEGAVACIVSILTGARWIHQIHGSSENYTGIKLLKSIFYQSLEKTLCRFFASKIIFTSKKNLIQLGYTNISKTKITYNAALELEKPNIDRNNSDSFKIFIVGRLAPIKRIDLAIKSFSQLLNTSKFDKKLELHILGKGPLEQDLKKLTLTLPGAKERIFFHGFVENPTGLIKNGCDLLLMTSDNEGIPTTILECMLLGIPVLARAVGGIPEINEIIPNYPLILVKSKDISIIAENLKEVILNYQKIFDKAQNTDCAYFKSSRLISEIIEIYYDIYT